MNDDDDTQELLTDVYQDVLHHLLVTQGFGNRTPPTDEMEDMWVKCLPGRCGSHGYLAIMLAEQEVAQVEAEVWIDPNDKLVDIVLLGCYIKRPMGVNHVAALLMGLGTAFLSCIGGADEDGEEIDEDDQDPEQEKLW